MTKKEAILKQLTDTQDQLKLLALQNQTIELLDQLGIYNFLTMLYKKRKDQMNDWIFHNYVPD